MTQEETWEDRDGTWALPSFVVRALCQTADLSPAELYFVLISLNIEERFREYWDNPAFFSRVGMADQAAESQRRFSNARIQHSGGRCDPSPGCVCCAYHDWLSRAGDLFWAAGSLVQAEQHYQRCFDEADGREFVHSSGIGGLTRLHFVRGEFPECVAAFRRGCPPRAFYVQQRVLDSQWDALEDGSARARAGEMLVSRFPGIAPYFLSKAKYMCRAIVAAAVRGGGIDNPLREMICDYFEIDTSTLDDLMHALASNDKELVRLQRRLTPKPVACGRTFDDLLKEGETERGRRLRDCVPRSTSFATASAAALDRFLKSGEVDHLDEMIRAGSPFGIAAADSLIIAEALYSRSEEIAATPARHLVLLRRFNTICHYPEYGFLDEYLEVMGQLEAEIEPGDVIAAILDVAWYKSPYSIDNTGPSGTPCGFGKTEISDSREWLEIVLRDYPQALDRVHLATRERAVEALFAAYQFLRQRFVEVRRGERWISEAQLGEAICTLFGREEVQRHARPLWLSPQHLDYFLPRYGLAIEYMGLQHYQPVDVFGGAKALGETKARDERKRALCESMEVTLVYVTLEEDIGRRAIEIFDRYGDRMTERSIMGNGSGSG